MASPAPEMVEIVKALARMAEARDYAVASKGRVLRNTPGQPNHDQTSKPAARH